MTPQKHLQNFLFLKIAEVFLISYVIRIVKGLNSLSRFIKSNWWKKIFIINYTGLYLLINISVTWKAIKFNKAYIVINI